MTAVGYGDRRTDKIVGRVLAEVRHDLGWSRRDVERESGGEFHRSTVGSYELGERTVMAQRLIALAGVYGVDPYHLLEVIATRVKDPSLSGEHSEDNA